MSPTRLGRDWPEKTGRAGKRMVEAEVESTELPGATLSVNEPPRRADGGHGDARGPWVHLLSQGISLRHTTYTETQTA